MPQGRTDFSVDQCQGLLDKKEKKAATFTKHKMHLHLPFMSNKPGTAWLLLLHVGLKIFTYICKKCRDVVYTLQSDKNSKNSI
jgi:hypothetical protein